MGEEAKWFETAGVSEEYAAADIVQNSQDINSLVKQTLDLQAYQGNSIRIPGEDASDESVAEFNQKLMDKLPGLYKMPGEDDAEGVTQLYQKLGMPKDKAEYGVSEVSGLNDEQLGQFLEAAHGAKMTKTQMAAMVEAINTVNGSEDAAAAEALEDAHAALKAEWGLAYDEKIALATALMNEEGSPVSGMDVSEINPDVLRWVSSIGKRLGVEGAEFSGQGDKGGAGHNTPEEAASQVAEIMGNRDHAYWNNGDPQHAAAVKKVVKLMAEANPDAPTSMDSHRANAALVAAQAQD